MGVLWIEKEEKILRDMATTGKTPKQISQVLKSRTPHGIKLKAVKMDISFAVEPEIDLDAFARLMKVK